MSVMYSIFSRFLRLIQVEQPEADFTALILTSMTRNLPHIVTAKIFVLTAYRFLKGGAAAARKLVDDYKPVFTKQEYIDFMESMISTKIGGEPHF